MSRLFVAEYHAEVAKIFQYGGSKKETSIRNAVERLFGKGYPDENISFEDSQTAVLVKHGQAAARIAMRYAEAVDNLLNFFVNYEHVEVRDFRATITKLKEDIPYSFGIQTGIAVVFLVKQRGERIEAS